MDQPFDESAVAQTISERRKLLEITAVVITGLGKFIFMDILKWRLLFITIAIIAWVVYIGYCKRKESNIMKYWGFRMDNFKQVCWQVLPFGLVSVAIFLTVGYSRDTINLTWHIIPILIIYPLWGVIQQFLMISLVAGNMKEMKGPKPGNFGIILITAILFALVHYPNIWLIPGTFVLALFYTYIFLKNRNVYVLGLFHGWLGGLFFYTVVGRDPFIEVFGPLLSLSAP